MRPVSTVYLTIISRNLSKLSSYCDIIREDIVARKAHMHSSYVVGNDAARGSDNIVVRRRRRKLAAVIAWPHMHKFLV